MPEFYLIDASPYLFRAYFSIPATISSPAGQQVNAVYGFTEFLIQVLKKSTLSHIALAFDGSLNTSFRNDIYPPYKAQRALPPPELEAQVELCLKVSRAMGMTTFIDDIFEADDLIATLIERLSGFDGKFVVVSSDKDLAQLVDARTEFWDFAKDRRYDVHRVKDHFGVLPEQMVDFLALVGDPVDNIPGVRGIGRKTAVILLQSFSSIEDIYTRPDEVGELAVRGADSLQRKLVEGREDAFLSKQLATLALNAPVDVESNQLRYKGARRELVEPLFTELGFERILERIPLWNGG